MKKILLSLLAAIGLGSTNCLAQEGQPANTKAIPSDSITILVPQAFITQAKADSMSIILDVRTPAEYAEGHIEGAHQLDFLNTEVFDARIKELDKAHTYYVYCRSGKRSHKACMKMKAIGLKVFDLEGGYLNWTGQGMPVGNSFAVKDC